MSSWGNTDTVASVPKYLSEADADKAYFVDTTEAAVASNKAKGLGAGWNTYSTYTDTNGKTRHKAELLVAMGTAVGTSGDVGAIIISSADMTTGAEYTIVTAGTSDYSAVGAANNDVGVTFTATGTAAGTGTVRPTEDDVVADS